ncbi:MAG: MBL fold metallo-hydrolase [Paracoccaceae bacterium]|nr:MBL fold metallo-hydrolase [Paracoccaceae bacterium]MDG2258758.1 MBL fold metallo-hydrolase [Paracoccaceae bacterium]
MPKTEFITLGTAGGPVPNLRRAQPAHAVVRGDLSILVDCGDGAMGQLMRAEIDFRNVHDIVLSHHHFDHIGGLFACLGKNMMLQRSRTLRIYGPKGTKRIVEGLFLACDISCEIGFGISGKGLPHPRDFVSVHEIEPGESFQVEDVEISCCENTHYRPENEFGTVGAVSLSLRFDAPDRSFVFTGDTGPCSAIVELASGADILFGEVMDVEKVMGRVRKKNPHMTADQIESMAKHMKAHHLVPEHLGELARKAKVGRVVCVHVPLDSIPPETAPDYVAKVATQFDGPISISEDLNRY